MLKTLLIINLVFLSISVTAQEENILLHTDKKICYKADTVWFRAVVVTDSLARPASNFYLELYSQEGMLISRKVFQVVNHAAYGQIEMPAVTGYYWLRGYTMNAANGAIVPINVLGADKQDLIVQQHTTRKKEEQIDTLVSLMKEGDGYTIQVNSKQHFNYSVSVTDTTDLSTATLLNYPMPAFSKRRDTSGLVFHANLQTKGKRKMDDADVLMYLQTGAQQSLKTQLSINNGVVTFQDLYFYDTAHIHYQFLRDGKPLETNSFLTLSADTFPVFERPAFSHFQKDTLHIGNKPPQKVLNEQAMMLKGRSKTLKTVEVKSRWQDRHLALNKKYVMSDEFKAIEHYTFDLRNPSNTGGVYFVLEYLFRELPPNWASNTLSGCREGIQCYIDEQLVNISIAAQRPLSDFAYAKIYQDLHPPCPSICLYTRKGSDLDPPAPVTGSLTVSGYTKSLTWTQPDAVTWLWAPAVTAQHYHFRNPPKAFKIVMVGKMEDGSPILYERIFNR